MKMQILSRFYHGSIFVLLLCVYIYQTAANNFEVPQAKFLQLAALTIIGLLLITKKTQDEFFRYQDFKRRDWLAIGAVIWQLISYYGLNFFDERMVAAMSNDPVLRIMMMLIWTLALVGPWAAALAANMVPERE